MVLLGIFAATGLLLAVVGLYGVMTTAVANRTHEIGIRMAVGARPSNIVRMILVQGAGPVLTGLSLGLFLAFALTRSLGESFIHGAFGRCWHLRNCVSVLPVADVYGESDPGVARE